MSNARTLAGLFLTVLLSVAAASPAALCSSGPSPRLACRLVYDPVNERLMMFGGMYERSQAQVFGDTWIFDWGTESWRLLEVEPHPPPRMDYGIAYVPELEGFILFGGWNTGGWLADTWLYDCASQAWTELHPDEAPEERASIGFCRDEANGVLVLYGGYTEALPDTGETWLYDYRANTWTLAAPEASPPPCFRRRSVKAKARYRATTLPRRSETSGFNPPGTSALPASAPRNSSSGNSSTASASKAPSCSARNTRARPRCSPATR